MHHTLVNEFNLHKGSQSVLFVPTLVHGFNRTMQQRP